jgi:hypothetical protein
MNSKNIISSTDAFVILKNLRIAETPLWLNSIQPLPTIHWVKTRVQIISVDTSAMKLRELESGQENTAPMEMAEFSRILSADGEKTSGLILKLSDGSQFTLSNEEP